jgi:hypothetical protein
MSRDTGLCEFVIAAAILEDASCWIRMLPVTRSNGGDSESMTEIRDETSKAFEREKDAYCLFSLYYNGNDSHSDFSQNSIYNIPNLHGTIRLVSNVDNDIMVNNV